jgi:sulfide:quinone oxidoreductase
MTDPATGFRVLVAGGGIAALEATLALRELAGDRVSITLLAPDPVFRHRPLSVTEPFGKGAAPREELLQMTLDLGVRLARGALAAVDPAGRRVTTDGGEEIEYDALLVAIGTQGVEAVPGAVTFRDVRDESSLRELLEEIGRAGAGRRIAFAFAGEGAWPLGLYELALMTRGWAQERDIELEISVVTPESSPLEIFGRAASDAIAGELSDAGIRVHTGCLPRRFDAPMLEVARGETIECDHVVALPRPQVAPIEGLPQDAQGFIGVDRFGSVFGLERVFAAGDVTNFPVKQGGLAAQQADSAASAIAELAGAPVRAEMFQPVLRGAVLTGAGPRYVRTRLDGSAPPETSSSVLWWPPAKIAGKYLAPFLAARAGHHDAGRPLVDLTAPPTVDSGAGHAAHGELVGMALSSADENARDREFSRALRWLEVAENLELYLPPEYERKRISWTERARGPE